MDRDERDKCCVEGATDRLFIILKTNVSNKVTEHCTHQGSGTGVRWFCLALHLDNRGSCQRRRGCHREHLHQRGFPKMDFAKHPHTPRYSIKISGPEN